MEAAPLYICSRQQIDVEMLWGFVQFLWGLCLTGRYVLNPTAPCMPVCPSTVYMPLPQLCIFMHGCTLLNAQFEVTQDIVIADTPAAECFSSPSDLIACCRMLQQEEECGHSGSAATTTNPHALPRLKLLTHMSVTGRKTGTGFLAKGSMLLCGTSIQAALCTATRSVASEACCNINPSMTWQEKGQTPVESKGHCLHASAGRYAFLCLIT